MKYVTEFRDVQFVKKILQRLEAYDGEEIVIMEVCGTHTMSIFKNGIRPLLPPFIKLISGPGCPVCVTSQGYIDTAIELAQREDVIIATFGDMLRVPGSLSTLQKERALGRNIQMVYSPLDAVNLAKENPTKEVVFLGIGFETTAPTIALSVKKAYEEGVQNYSVLQSIKTMPEAMRQLVLDQEIRIDGFLCPGHVSTIIGVHPYEFLAKDFNIPAVVAGFEAGDILLGLESLVKMIRTKEYQVLNQYPRVVKDEGNLKALSIIEEIFEPADSVWRGLGMVEKTGLALKEPYKKYNTEEKLGISMKQEVVKKGCICGEILKGKQTPLECKLFGKACSPISPIGACMVSEEGTCAAYYKYHVS